MKLRHKPVSQLQPGDRLASMNAVVKSTQFVERGVIEVHLCFDSGATTTARFFTGSIYPTTVAIFA